MADSDSAYREIKIQHNQSEMGRVGFEPTTPAMSRQKELTDNRRFEPDPNQFVNQEFWNSFRDYLKNQNNKTTASDRIDYAKKYYYVLVNNDPSDILSLSFNKRLTL